MKKEKLSNFFYYNKFKILIIIILAITIIASFNQCRNRAETSLGILYATETPSVDSSGFTNKITNAKIIKTSDNNYATADNIFFKDIYLSPNETELMQSRVLEQLQVEIAAGTCKIIISDNDTMYTYSKEEAFSDITSYADKYNIDDKDRYKDENGKTIGISIENNSFFESCGIPTKELFITVRNHTDKEKDEYKNAYNMLDYVLKNK